MKIKYIFFDFDGVLAESVNIKTEAFRQMYLSEGKEFSDKVVDYHVANGGVSRYEKFKIFNGEWLGEDVTESKSEKLAQTFSDLVVEGVINSPEVTGALAFLNTSSEYKKYIITGTPTNEIEVILKERKMDHFFIEAYGSPNKKDFWVKKILSENSINPDECVFIGDALADYEAAMLNNVAFILRETIEGKELFKDYTGLRIKDMTSLQSTINQINQSK